MFIAIMIILIIVFRINYYYNQNTSKATEEIIKALRKHSPEELSEIVEWEKHLRMELVLNKARQFKGEVTEEEYESKVWTILEAHREIEQKYNVTEEEMSEYYLSAKIIEKIY
jgi:hypothetical protein